MMAEAFEALDKAEGVDFLQARYALAWSSEQTRPVELNARVGVNLEDLDDAASAMHEALQTSVELGRRSFATWSARAWRAS